MISNRIWKKVSFYIFCFCVFLISLLITLFIINFFQNINNNDVILKESSSIEIISEYSKKDAIKGLSLSIYTKLPDNKSIIRYKRTNSNYEIITQSEKTVEYVSKSKLSIDDTLSIKNQTTTFMKNNGLNVDDYNPKADQFSSYMTYGDDDVICQLYSTAKKQVSGENYPYHRLSCVNITAVNNNYSQIENLLTIYKKSNSLPEFSKVLVSTKTDGKKSYSIINLVGDGASPRLLFAAISGDWAYLGELPERNFKDKNSNYILDSELSSKINDPKYGDFIAKDIK